MNHRGFKVAAGPKFYWGSVKCVEAMTFLDRCAAALLDTRAHAREE